MCNLTFLLQIIIFTLVFPLVGVLHALEQPGTELNEVGARPVLGQKVTLSAQFFNEKGEVVPLKSLFRENTPVIIVPAFFRCPRLCGLIHQGVLKLLNEMSLTVGADITIATVSFDPQDTSQEAHTYAARYQPQYRAPDLAREGWRFLTGVSGSEKTLMNELGFHYKQDGEEFAHTAAIFILTPDGEISQYFTGIEFSAFDAKLALIEAAKGAIGTPFDHILLYCFRFDDREGRYTLAAYNAVRAGSGVGFLLLAGLLISLWRRELRKKRESGVSSLRDVD